MAVLHVTQVTEYGLAACVLDLVRDQVARGWEVEVACPAGPGLAEDVVRAGATHHPWPAVRSPLAGVARELRTLRAVAARVQPAVVHLHSSKAGLVGRLLLRGRTPTLFQPHAWSFYALGGGARAAAIRWERLAARWSTLAICCSRDEEQLGRGAGIAGAMQVIPNSVDLHRFAPAPGGTGPARDRLGLPAAVPIVLCPARLCHQKGQDILLRSWPTVQADVPDAVLVLAGDGPDASALRAVAPEGVRFVGRQQDMPSWLGAADVVVLPSRYEGMALGVLEAMASGRCVVAAAADGMAEALGPDGASAVVPVEDPDALAAALARRLRDPGLRDAEGERNRRRAERHHDLRVWLDAMAAVTTQVARRTTA